MFCQVFSLLSRTKTDKLTFMTQVAPLKTQQKIAVISMSADGLGLQGQRALEALAHKCGDYNGLACMVREGGVLPDLNDFDVLLSSGGPGDPTELGDWGQAYAELIEAIRVHNQNHPDRPKRVFLVCHSFQVMSHYWGLGQLSERPFAMWGIQRQISEALPADAAQVFPTDDFYAFESRFYQVQPTYDLKQKCAELDIVVTSRDEQGALTTWQTRDGHIVATQFHPEALAVDLVKLMDNRPVGDIYCINMCPPHMIDETRERLHLLPVMEQVLTDFITKTV